MSAARFVSFSPLLGGAALVLMLAPGVAPAAEAPPAAAASQSADSPQAAATAPDTSEILVTDSQREALSLTVYTQDLALVKDRRRVDLPVGPVRLVFEDVSAGTLPPSVLLRPVGTGVMPQVREQTFDFNLLSPKSLREAAVGRTVTVVRTVDGREERKTATLLSVNDGMVVRYDDGAVEANPPGRLVYGALPPGLHDRPALSVTVAAQKAGARSLELGYLTKGLSWSANYVAELASEGAGVRLQGWATLTSTAGVAFADAQITLAAGDLHTAPPQDRAAPVMMMAESAPSAPQPEKVLGAHFYPIDQKVSLADNQTKQVALLPGHETNATLSRRVMVPGHGVTARQSQPYGTNATIRLTLHNTRKAGLGTPLPAGTVRVYRSDERGRLQFVGEDHLKHTAVGADAALVLGKDFDVPVTVTQTDFNRLSQDPDVFESAFDAEIRNSDPDQPVTVALRQQFPGDWRLLQEEIATKDESRRATHEKVDSATAQWQVTVPAASTATLKYRVRVRM